MPWLFFAGLILLILSFFYDPSIWLGKTNAFVKSQEKRPLWREANGFIAIFFGFALAVAFVLHLIQEIKWFFVLLTSLILILMGFLFVDKRINKIARYDFISRAVKLAQAFEGGLKKSVGKKGVVCGLFLLGVLAIVFATILDFH